MFVQIEIPQLTGLLKYGVPGLCAIAFILSYLLIFREGNRPKPRTEMLRSIRMFMGITVILGVASAYVAIKNPSQPAPAEHRAKKTPKPKHTVKTSPSNSFAENAINNSSNSTLTKVEIFYIPETKNTAKSLADGLQDSFEVVITPLSQEKKRKLKANRNEIRHEAIEKSIAQKLQQQVNKILAEEEIIFELKQITSVSNNYLSLFICE